MHPAQQTRQRRNQQFEGFDERKYTVDPRTGWNIHPSTRPTTSSSSAHWEQHDDWKSTFSLVQVVVFACRKFQFLGNRRGVWTDTLVTRHILRRTVIAQLARIAQSHSPRNTRGSKL